MKTIAGVCFMQVCSLNLPVIIRKHLSGVVLHVLIDIHLRLLNFDFNLSLLSEFICLLVVQIHHNR